MGMHEAHGTIYRRHCRATRAHALVKNYYLLFVWPKQVSTQQKLNVCNITRANGFSDLFGVQWHAHCASTSIIIIIRNGMEKDDRRKELNERMLHA